MMMRERQHLLTRKSGRVTATITAMLPSILLLVQILLLDIVLLKYWATALSFVPTTTTTTTTHHHRHHFHLPITTTRTTAVPLITASSLSSSSLKRRMTFFCTSSSAGILNDELDSRSSLSSSSSQTTSLNLIGRDNVGGAMGYNNNNNYNFTSEPFHVYIEDTDAYGIMYNSNYLRAYERALFLEYRTAASSGYSSNMNEKSDSINGINHILTNDDNDEHHPAWSIVAVGRQKFVSAPGLGEGLVIHGQLTATSVRSLRGDSNNVNDNINDDDELSPDQQRLSQSSTWTVWDMQVTSPDGNKVYNQVYGLVVASPPAWSTEGSASPLSSTSTFGTTTRRVGGTLATIQEYLPPDAIISRSGSATRNDGDKHDEDNKDDSSDVVVPGIPRQSVASAPSDSSSNSRSSTFPIHRDEMVHGATLARLPLRTILNYFERGRTNAFGGPNNLRRLQEDGIHAVVTSIRDISLIWTDRDIPTTRSDDDEEVNGLARMSMIYPESDCLRAGETIKVETITTVKRKGMILEMDQRIIRVGGKDNPSSTSVIAQGLVSLMMVDIETRRPTSKLPSWVQTMFEIDEEARREENGRGQPSRRLPQ